MAIIPQKLLEIIEIELVECSKNQQSKPIEFATLTTHLDMVKDAQDNQQKLEEVLRSLENNPVLGGNYWRDASTV